MIGTLVLYQTAACYIVLRMRPPFVPTATILNRLDCYSEGMQGGTVQESHIIDKQLQSKYIRESVDRFSAWTCRSDDLCSW
jgi:hypothetical protein